MNSDFDYDDAKVLQGIFRGPIENYGQGPKGRRKKGGKKKSRGVRY